MSIWREWAAGERAAIESLGQWRTIRPLDGGGTTARLADGRSVVQFASNDYLGLSQHPAVKAAAVAATQRWGTGAGSARLVVGARPLHDDLESALAGWRGSEAALLFPTGFAANLGVLTTMLGPGTAVVSDELNHASIIDGTRLSKATTAIYRHADVADAAHAIERVRAAGAARVALVTDTVFSMDGDEAPIDELVALCADADVLLVVDEAHAVLGPTLVPGQATVLRVGTLSKALGSLGGFVAGPAALVDLVRNRARSFIFTTASTPADAAAAQAALAIVTGPEGDRRRATLRALIDRVKPGHPSPIVPVLVGDERAAVDAAAELADQGLWVPAIRPPTVAPGTSRLRVSLSADHDPADVDRLVKALDALGLCP